MAMSLILLTGLSELTTCCRPSMYPLFSSSTTVFTLSVLLTELRGDELFPPLPMITFTLRPLMVRPSVNVTSDSVIELFWKWVLVNFWWFGGRLCGALWGLTLVLNYSTQDSKYSGNKIWNLDRKFGNSKFCVLLKISNYEQNDTGQKWHTTFFLLFSSWTVISSGS